MTAGPGEHTGRRPWLSGIPVGRLSGFLGLPLISAIAPFLVLPVLLRYVGTQAWAGIAIGQSVGTGASTFIMLGWPVVGPSLVARNRDRQRGLYSDSLVSRLTAFCLAAPVAMAIAGSLAPRSSWVDATGMALASAMLGLSANWFFVGIGMPSAIARFDTVPRVAATGLAALLISWLSWAWLYPACLLLTSAVMIILVSTRYWDRERRPPLTTTVRVIRTQSAAVGVSVQAALNTMLPMTLVAFFAPAAVPGFAAIDRITKFVIFVLQPVGLAFQGWVAEPSDSPEGRRRTAFAVSSGAGLALATGYLLAAPFLLRVLFAGKITVTYPAALFYALAIVCIALSMTLGFHFLAPLDMSRWMAMSAVVNTVVTTLAIGALVPRYGVTGASLSVLLAELAVTLTQASALLGGRGARRRALAAQPVPLAAPDGAAAPHEAVAVMTVSEA